jgi:hypothetical protein
MHVQASTTRKRGEAARRCAHGEISPARVRLNDQAAVQRAQRFLLQYTNHRDQFGGVRIGEPFYNVRQRIRLISTIAINVIAAHNFANNSPWRT